MDTDSKDKAYLASISLHYIAIVIYALGTLSGITLFTVFITMNFNDYPGIFLVAFILAILLLTFHSVAVRGLILRKSWGYKLSKLLGFIMLLGFPLGTVLGGLLLYELSKYQIKNQEIMINHTEQDI